MDERRASEVEASLRAWAPLLETREARQASAELDALRPELVEAVLWAVEHDPPRAAHLLWDGATYWVVRAMTSDAVGWATRLLPLLPEPTEGRALVLGVLARLGGVRRDLETREYAREALALGTELRLDAVSIEALYELAAPDDTGDVTLALTLDACARVRALHPSGVREGAILVDLEAAAARRSRDPEGEARIYERALADARREGLLRRMVHLGGNLAEVLLRLGRTQAAGATAGEAVLDAREIGDVRNEARALGVLAVAHALQGDTRRAGRALRRAALLASAEGTTLARGHAVRSAELVHAAIGDRDAQPPRMPASHDGDAADAVARVAEFGDRLASVPIGGRASLAGVLGLTPREIEVLTLLGAGLSDRDIAGRLFISPKTVSVHLANARAKTGLRSRVALAVAGRNLLEDAESTAAAPAGGPTA